MTLPYGISRGYDRSKRTSPWFVRVNGKKVAHFSTEELRDRDYNQRVGEAKLYGQQAMVQLGAGDRHAIEEMKRQAAAVGLDALEIFRLGLTLTGDTQRRVKECGKAGAAFTDWVDARLKRGTIRVRRAKELKHMVERLCERRGDEYVHQISREDIRFFLKGLDVSAQTERNNAASLRQFFDWCIGEGWRKDNPVVMDYRIDRTPATFTAAQVKGLFTKAAKLHPSLLPMMILQWFAGIRPTATHLMDWRDIDFGKRHIVIQPEANKTRQPDLVDSLPDAFWEKLAPFRQDAGPVRAPAHIKRYREVRNALGYGEPPRKRWPTDVARHSFASHLYGLSGDIVEVSRALRHTGSKVTLKHYVAKHVTLEEGKAYFALAIPQKTGAQAALPRRGL
ncbi:MAG: hypothetical protein NDI75_15055, partial [Candidatus Didemnitutus sp.]|nr:hypothetical protein [Candidatus Didemnitutus sp.]